MYLEFNSKKEKQRFIIKAIIYVLIVMALFTYITYQLAI